MSKRNFIILILMVVLGVLLWRIGDRAATRHYADFRAYYAASERILSGENLYIEHGKVVGSFKYWPIVALAMAPLTIVSEGQAYFIFSLINLLSVFVILLLLERLIFRAGNLSSAQRALVWGLPVLLAGRFILGTIDTGQVILLLMLFCTAGLYFSERNRPIAAGACMAFAIAIKYMPVFFLPYFLIKRKFKAFIWTIAFLIFLAWLPSLWIGAGKNFEYIQNAMPGIIQTSLDRGSFTDYKNLSFFSALIRLISFDSPYRDISVNIPLLPFGQALSISVILGGLGLLASLGMFAAQRGSARYDEAALFIWMTLLNPNAWPFNYSVFLVGGFVLVSGLVAQQSDASRRFWIALGVMFLLVYGGGQSLGGDHWQKIVFANSVLTWAALLFIGVLFLAKKRFGQQIE